MKFQMSHNTGYHFVVVFLFACLHPVPVHGMMSMEYYDFTVRVATIKDSSLATLEIHQSQTLSRINCGFR